MKRGWKILLIFVAVAIILFWILYGFYFRKCENQTCFDDYLRDCKRARFINDGKMAFEYKILGKSGESCEVSVKLLEGDLTNQESLKLEDRSMTCLLPLGIAAVPEADIGLCAGPLKEGMQDLIINKLYAYIVQNFGKINADLLNF